MAGLIGSALLLVGCNLVPMAHRVIAEQYRDAELVSQTVQLGPDRIQYWVGGGERPILLLHGFGLSATWQWFEQAPSFAEDHRLIIPDLLWFGGSDSDDSDDSVQHQTNALIALLDHLGEERVDVVGISYGGMVAYDLASRFPDRVRRLVLVDSPGRSYEAADYEALCERFGVEDFGEVLIPDDTAGMRTLVATGFERELYAPGFVLRQARRDLIARHENDKREVLDALLEEFDSTETRQPRARDTLIVWGRGDPIFPLPLARRLKEQLGVGARLEILDHTRHAPNIERADAFDALVLQFLEMPCSCER